MYYCNSNVKELNRIFDQNERQGYLRLDLNENPGGLPEHFIKEVIDDITVENISQYPETKPFSLKLAKYIGTNIENVCLVNGSAEGIRYIIQAFTSEGGEIVGAIPSYMMFQIYSEMYGRKFVGVPYEGTNMNIDRIIEKLSCDTQLLILLNPNNPMGNVYSEEEIEKLLDVAEKYEITVLIDEAYYYFHPNTFIKYALEREHIFITRTFSKLFSMAGCRLGYVVGWAEGVKCVQKLCTPHNTNVLALKMGEKMLDSPNIIDELISKYRDGRKYLVEWLDEHDYTHIGESGNFIFIKPKTDAEKIVLDMKDKKRILIKKYANVGAVGDCLRVTIGETRFMKTFTEALMELDNQ